MGWGIHPVARNSEDGFPSLFRLLGGSTVVCSIGYVVEISGFEPEQTEPKSVVLPLHHISGTQSLTFLPGLCPGPRAPRPEYFCYARVRADSSSCCKSTGLRRSADADY